MLLAPKSPNLPLAANEYDRPQQDQTNNALRLYFNQLDSTFGNVLRTAGGGQLSFPYGSLMDITNQSVVGANTPTKVKFATVDMLNDMTDGSDRLTVSQSGIYNLQYSLQFENADSVIQEATVWIKKNGVDVTRTGSQWSVPNKHGAVNGYALGACNFYISLTAGDYVELWWATTTTLVIIEAYAAQTVPYARPAIPSSVMTLSFVAST